MGDWFSKEKRPPEPPGTDRPSKRTDDEVPELGIGGGGATGNGIGYVPPVDEGTNHKPGP